MRTNSPPSRTPIIPPCSAVRMKARRRSNGSCTASPAVWIAGIANIAAVRGVKLHSVEAELEGDIDLQGILGLSDTVRNGFSNIRVAFKVAGDAPAEMLKALVAQSQARSAVFDMLTNGVPVSISVEA